MLLRACSQCRFCCIFSLSLSLYLYLYLSLCLFFSFLGTNKICHCFHYAFKPSVLPYEFFNELKDTAIAKPNDGADAGGEATNEGGGGGAGEDAAAAAASLDSLARRYPDPFLHVADSKHAHYWSIHKWVSHHHIAHWAQKLLIFQSIYQHHELLDTMSLPPLDGIVFHDTSNTNPPLEGHFLSVFGLSVEAAVGYTEESAAADAEGEGERWAHPNLWAGSDAEEQMAKLLHPASGRLIWTEDIVQQTFTTTLPPGACDPTEHETDDTTPSKCKVPNPAYQAAMIAIEAEARMHPPVPADGSAPPLQPLPVPTNADGTPLVEHVADPSLQTCFARVSMSPTYGLLSMDSADAVRFREVTSDRMALPDQFQRPCPPRRAILLTRPDRKILNVHLIDRYMLEKYGLILEHHELSGRNTSLQQVHLFATSGLVLSSHSSQLINVLFSHAAQALVEITAEFYNVDFAAYAHALGLSFHYALGGSIPKSHEENPAQSEEYTYVHDPLMIDCVSALQGDCPTGDSWCISRQSPIQCGKIVQWPNKQMNFQANITAIHLAVQSAVAHIQDKCFGKW